MRGRGERGECTGKSHHDGTLVEEAELPRRGVNAKRHTRSDDENKNRSTFLFSPPRERYVPQGGNMSLCLVLILDHISGGREGRGNEDTGAFLSRDSATRGRVGARGPEWYFVPVNAVKLNSTCKSKYKIRFGGLSEILAHLARAPSNFYQVYA